MTLVCLPAFAADPPAPETTPPENVAPVRREAPSPDDATQSARPGSGAERKALNLLGEVDSASGESRRNENVRITLVDNAVQRELNERMGASATIVTEFNVESNYFGAEFGGSPSSTLHLTPNRRRSLHGSLYEMHNNSLFSARSFFQAGGVKPARSNDYGFAVTVPLGRRAALSVDANQNKIRGNVNGNVLVPLPHERTPLDRDPLTGEPVDQATKNFIKQMMSAYPEEPPIAPISTRERSTPTRRNPSTATSSGPASMSICLPRITLSSTTDSPVKT